MRVTLARAPVKLDEQLVARVAQRFSCRGTLGELKTQQPQPNSALMLGGKVLRAVVHD